MTLKEISEKITSDEYGFLYSNENLCENLILVGLGGSHAYGTNTEESDLDIRGIATNTRHNILVGKDFEQVVDVKTDTTIYSFDKMVRLLCACNPNCIELVGLKPEHYLYITDVGQYIVDHASMFLSKRAIHSFGGYANAQLRRLDNKAAKDANQVEREKHILESLKNASYSFKDRYSDAPSDAIKLYTDESSRDEFEEEIFMDVVLHHYPLRDYAGMISEYQSIIRQYNKCGRRNDRAYTHGKIAKHMMHLVRLYLMCFDILIDGKVVTYREKEHDMLMDIRNGKFLNENNQPKKVFYELVDELDNKLAYWKEHTDLPDSPDMSKVETLVEKVNGDICGKE